MWPRIWVTSWKEREKKMGEESKWDKQQQQKKMPVPAGFRDLQADPLHRRLIAWLVSMICELCYLSSCRSTGCSLTAFVSRFAWVSLNNPFSTAVLIWGQTTHKLREISRPRDCSPKGGAAALPGVSATNNNAHSGTEKESTPFVVKKKAGMILVVCYCCSSCGAESIYIYDR